MPRTTFDPEFAFAVETVRQVIPDIPAHAPTGDHGHARRQQLAAETHARWQQDVLHSVCGHLRVSPGEPEPAILLKSTSLMTHTLVCRAACERSARANAGKPPNNAYACQSCRVRRTAPEVVQLAGTLFFCEIALCADCSR